MYYHSKKVFTSFKLRERLLEERADDLVKKKGIGFWCDLFRKAACDIDNIDKGDVTADQIPTIFVSGHRTPGPMRGRGGFAAVQDYCRPHTYSQ